MRFRFPAYVLLVALAACGSSSAASEASSTAARPATHAASCGPRHARTIAASRRARVYALGGTVWGCATGGSRSYRLGAGTRSIREGRVGPVAVAGRYAGYALTTFGIDTVSAEVIVRDLRSGRQLRALAPTTSVLPESIQAVDSIVVKADGAVAWISQAASIVRRGSGKLEVQRADLRGQALLDSGTSIDSKSLRLNGSTLTWRHGSNTRTATLF